MIGALPIICGVRGKGVEMGLDAASWESLRHGSAGRKTLGPRAEVHHGSLHRQEVTVRRVRMSNWRHNGGDFVMRYLFAWLLGVPTGLIVLWFLFNQAC